MFKLNNVGKKLYFSVLAVFLVFAAVLLYFSKHARNSIRLVR